MDKNRKDLLKIFLKDFFKFIMVCLISLIVVIFVIGDESTIQLKNIREKYIGEKIVITNDTLTIEKYNFWYDTFELSDGSSVSPKIMEDNLLK